MGLVGLIAELAVIGACCAAVVFNGLLLGSCDFMHLENARGEVTGTFGMYKAQFPGTEECVYISDVVEDVEDGYFKCAQVCALMAFICGCGLFAFGLFKQCIIPLPCTQLIMDLCSTLTQVFLGLTYIVWASEACDLYRCNYGDGANYLILSQICWLIAGCFTRCMRPGRWERRDEIAANKKAKQEEKKRREAEEELKKKEEELEARERAVGEVEDPQETAQPY